MYMWVMAVMAAMASVGPVLLGYLLTRVGNWRTIFFSLAAALWLVGLVLRKIQGVDSGTIPAGEETTALSGRQLLSSPVLWLIGFLVILDNLASGNLLAWTPRLFQIRHGADETRAGLLLTANTIGMLVGRILMGAFVSGKVSERILLGSCYAAGMMAYAVILWVPSYPVGIAMMALQGAFLSAQAPTTYSLTTRKFPARAAVAVPLVDAIGSIGGFSGPALLGWSAEHLGDLGTVMWIIPCMGLFLAAISLGWEYFDRWGGNRKNAPPATSAIGT
jgi:MFS family permease